MLALDHDVPRGREVVAALVRYLVAHGLNSADVTILTVAGQNSPAALAQACRLNIATSA